MTNLRIKSAPQALKPFLCHGINLDLEEGAEEALGDCPKCGKHDHLYINKDTGQFNCKVCGFSGNAISFLTWLSKELQKSTTKAELETLGKNRGSTKIGRKRYESQIPIKVLKSFGVCFNDVTKEWLIPIRNETGSTIRDLRRWGRGQMFATAGMKIQLGGLERLKKVPNTGTVFMCEGDWDPMAMQWLLDSLGRSMDCVVWTPGATVFKEDWVKYLKGRKIVAIYDSDRAGDEGQELCLKRMAKEASELKFVCWPESKPKGYDLRDYIVRCMSQNRPPQEIFDDLIGLCKDTPRRMTKAEVLKAGGKSLKEQADEEDEEELEPAELSEVIDTFNRHVLMSEDMKQALKICLAVCLSNEMPSDPLWLYLIGPPGAGKTLLLSSLQSSTKCKFVSTITAHSLVSGWRGDGDNDPSLIPKLKGKTFIAKDFTEILTMPAMVQDDIFSTLRGAYDGYVQRPFGNGVMREYKDCHFSMIAGVTHAVHGHAKASLGERFIKFQLSSPSKAQADAIVMAAMASVGREKEMETELQEVTRRFLAKKIKATELPRAPESIMQRLTALVQLIAVMRAQVERDFRGEEVLYRPTPESGTRLAKQLVKLAMMLAAVEDKKEIDESIFKLVQKVAYDTAYGFHLDVIESIMKLGGSAIKSEIAEAAELPGSTLNRRMDDLLVLKAIRLSDFDKKHGKHGGRPSRVYEVTERVAELWRKAKGLAEPKIANHMVGKRRRRKTS